MVRILVVDDESLIRVLVADVGESLGHEVLTAASIKEGQDLAQRGVPYWFVSEAGADHSMAWRPMREHFAEIDAFLDRFVFGGERRRFETRIVPPDAPERPAAFAIDDYLDANYGHYVPGKKRQPSETFRKGYRQ